jgi:hypothetical protein
VLDRPVQAAMAVLDRQVPMSMMSSWSRSPVEPMVS